MEQYEKYEVDTSLCGESGGMWNTSHLKASECVSRDSGFDLETDECLNKLEYCKDEMMKNCDDQFCGNNGSLEKWCFNRIKNDGDRNSNMKSCRNSLHWEEFFGKPFCSLS